MKKIFLVILTLGFSNSCLLAVPLGLVDETEIIDYGADISIYTDVYDVDPTDVITQRDLLRLVADATGLSEGGFNRFVCLPSGVSWGGNSEFVSEGPGSDRGWENTVIDLRANEYVTPNLNQLLDENVLEALNEGGLQIVYQ